MSKKPIYQYQVVVYQRKDNLWEIRVARCRGEHNIVLTSNGQGYNRWQTAMKVAKSLFAGAYGLQFLLYRKGKPPEEVRPW